ncbi:hypothetical protein MTO96_013765 [Rhipicephalus appendiculatus]
MFGPGKRELSLVLHTSQNQSSRQSKTGVLFRAYGGTVADRWYHVARTIRFSAHTTALEFSVSSDKCEQGDVALSNIHVTPGACLDDSGQAGFLQLSWARGAANQANLTSVLWHAHDQPRTVELWYYGDATEHGMLNVYLVDKAGLQLAKIWTLPNTTEPRTWSLARAEIPDQSMDFKVVIEGKFGPLSNANSVIAVDDVLIDLPLPAHVADCAGNPGRFAYVDTTVTTNKSVTPTATLRSAYFSSNGNETMAVRYFRNGTALRSFQVYQLVVNSGGKGTIRLLLADLSPGEQWQRVELPLQKADQSQLEFTLTGSPSQRGGVTAIATITVASTVKGGPETPEEPIPDLACSFDNGSYCLWKPDTNSKGQPQWELSDPATGRPTFPLFDHSTRNSSGRFIFSQNTGSAASVNRIKSLPLPLQLSTSSLCFSFWYFMLTDRNSSISVTLAPSSSPSWLERGARMTAWTPAMVHLAGSAAPVRTQIVVESSIQDGLIAADDFSVAHGDCPIPSLCAFEGSVECGHTQDISNVREWIVQQGSELGVTDHTLRSTFGHFLYLNTTSVRQSRNSIARIHLPVRNATPIACLTFWWRAHGDQSERSVYR